MLNVIPEEDYYYVVLFRESSSSNSTNGVVHENAGTLKRQSKQIHIDNSMDALCSLVFSFVCMNVPYMCMHSKSKHTATHRVYASKTAR